MYKMMNAQEIAEYIVHNIDIECVNFSFDTMDDNGKICTASGSPEGWHGIRILNPFNTETYIVAIGYYGGYTTKFSEKPYFGNPDSEIRWLTKVIYSYFKDEDEFDSQNKKVCVEVLR